MTIQDMRLRKRIQKNTIKGYRSQQRFYATAAGFLFLAVAIFVFLHFNYEFLIGLATAWFALQGWENWVLSRKIAVKIKLIEENSENNFS